MIVVHGESKWEQLIVKKLRRKVCPQCKDTDSLELCVFTSYHHLYEIPFGSKGKQALIVCSKCGKIVKEHKFPASVKEMARIEKEHITIPKKHYLGFLLLLGLGVLMVIGILLANKYDKWQIENPEQGDIYVYETLDNDFSIMRVEEVLEDGVVVIYNNYVSNKSYGLKRDLNQEKRWDYSFYDTIANKQIQEMYQENIIKSVE